MSETPKMSLKRPINRMPTFVKNALNDRGLLGAYRERPPYQRNDYLGRISRAKKEATKSKRLNQMLDELRGGKLYMKMANGPRANRGRHLCARSIK